MEKRAKVLWASIALENLDASSITKEIVLKLRSLGLDLSHILSQCYDGASVMAGVKGGVQQLLQEKSGRWIPYIHCFNHQLHLVVIDVVSCEKQVQDFYDLCSALYKFLKKHHVRKHYKGTTLSRLLDQRWTGHLEITTAVLRNKESILETLNILRNDCKVLVTLNVEAAGIYSKMKQPHFWLIGIFLEKLLLCLKPLNAILQDRSTDIVTALDLLQVTLEELKGQRSEEFFRKIWERHGTCIELGAENVSKRKCKPRKSLSDFVLIEPGTQEGREPYTQINMRRLYFSILDRTISEIESRFSEKNNSLLRSLSCLIPRSQTFLHDSTCIDPIAKMIMSETEIEQLHNELKSAKLLIEKNVHENEEIGYVLQFLGKYRLAYPKLYHIYCAAVTFGVSTSECERSFSFLNRILSPVRSSMLHSRKSNLVLLSVEKRLARLISKEEFMQEFSRSSRKLLL